MKGAQGAGKTDEGSVEMNDVVRFFQCSGRSCGL